MYGYGYGYSSPSFGVGAAGGIFLTLLVIGFIAAIILAVVVYRKYASDGTEQLFSFKDRSTWGPFLRFDKLVIDKILKALYIFTAIFTAFFFLAIVLASLADGIGVFLITLIMCAIVCLIVELLERVTFESVMLSVIVARNTNDIKNMMGSRPAAPLPPAGPAPEAPVPSAPEAPVAPAGPAPAGPAPEAPVPPAPSDPVEPLDPQPAPAAEPAGGEQVASEAPKFCPVCGTAIKPGSHFCPECGKKLD